jgi:hypothetical protein
VLQVLIDIDYYKNRLQILALRPAPIQVRTAAAYRIVWRGRSAAGQQINFLAHPGTCGASYDLA